MLNTSALTRNFIFTFIGVSLGGYFFSFYLDMVKPIKFEQVLLLTCFIATIITIMPYVRSILGLRSFYDSLSREVSRIREDLIDISLNQVNLGDDKVPYEFLCLQQFYANYPYMAAIRIYNIKYSHKLNRSQIGKNWDDYYGRIIISLDNDNETWSENLKPRFQNASELIQFNTRKRIDLKEGMNLQVHIWEEEIDFNFDRTAKIIELIETFDFGRDLVVTLEIYLVSKEDFYYDGYSSSEVNKEIEDSKIIRRIKITDYYKHGIYIK